MKTNNRAEINAWYQSPEGERFKVVAEDDDSIEIQYFNGDVEEIDKDNWWEMGLVAIQAPEDWSGPFDDLINDDFGDTEKAYHPGEQAGTVDLIESENDIDWED